MNFKIDIPIDANIIIYNLQLNGYSAYICGGAVRDSIMNKKPHDWDICTSATPQEVLTIFKEYKIIETGLQHGTVTIVLNGEPYEVTTYRIDGDYSDNRRPDSVDFTTDLIEDLKRRDFTINAMAYNDNEGLIDPFLGLEDINNKLIRCVGSAQDRFEEDALRIMRAIRFSSQLEFNIDKQAVSEIFKQYTSLRNVSIERINSEFCKIVKSNMLSECINTYKDVFSFIIPELKEMVFNQNNPYHEYTVYMHTIIAISKCEHEEPIIKLAVLFHDIGKPHCYQDDSNGIRHFKGHGKVSADMAKQIMKRMKFDNETINNVVELVLYHDATFEVGKKYVKRWLNKIGVEQFRRLLIIRKADIKGQSHAYEQSRIDNIINIEKLLEEVLEEQSCFSLKDLAINGNDVKRCMEIKEGKDIGKWLNHILDNVIDGDLPNNKDDLEYYLHGIHDGWMKL